MEWRYFSRFHCICNGTFEGILSSISLSVGDGSGINIILYWGKTEKKYWTQGSHGENIEFSIDRSVAALTWFYEAWCLCIDSMSKRKSNELTWCWFFLSFAFKYFKKEAVYKNPKTHQFLFALKWIFRFGKKVTPNIAVNRSRITWLKIATVDLLYI